MPLKSPQASYLWQEHVLSSPVDQTRIRYALYRSRSIEPKRYIVFLNGRTEWIEKYHDLPNCLRLPAGYGFLTMDHRGQGASEGHPAHVDSYDDFAKDAQAVIQAVVGARPYGLIGHSMGGLISLYACLKELIRPEFLVLSSPLLMLPNGPIPRPISKPISQLLSCGFLRLLSTGVSSHNQSLFHENSITHSYEGFCRVQNSPYTCASPTIGWVQASFQATSYVMRAKHLHRLPCPTLILCGSKETVVEYLGFPYWVQKASQHSSARVELSKIPGARHELLNEIPRYRDEAVRRIRQWAQANHFFNVQPVACSKTS